MNNELRYEIGTLENDNFVVDSISNDPDLTGFPTIFLAIQELREVIRASTKMWGAPMTNGAVRDSETGRIVWRQDEDA